MYNLTSFLPFFYLFVDTFSRMMWFKTTSVYLALSAGFEVMFQDVDLVWLKGKLLYYLCEQMKLWFMNTE